VNAQRRRTSQRSEAAQIVFQAGWPLTMVGLDVGDKTLLTRKHIEALKKIRAVSDFIYKVADFLIGSVKSSAKPARRCTTLWRWGGD